MSDYQERLEHAVRTNAAVVVLGTGVSRALSRGHATSDWVGLIKSGLGRVVELDVNAANWRARQDGVLDLALEEGDSDALIAVASQVKARLLRHGRQAYSDWLRDDIGDIKVRDPSLASAVASLRAPIVTTNYDSLLEDALKRTAVPWTDTEGMREIFRSESDSIGHLHGHWKTADSVILSGEDYGGLLLSDPAQALEQAHYASKQFIFIGYGAGLADPNFSRLLAWHRKLFPESRGDHFRLCRASESAMLINQHAGDDIRVIAYGSEYDELSPFLSALRPPSSRKRGGAVERDAVAYAREAIVEQLRAETVIGDNVADLDERQLPQLVVAPVLLPMPHEQFVNARAAGEGPRPERIQVDTLYNSSRTIIVAGEELSGVTTTLKWLISQAALARPRTAPLYVDARNCIISMRPLEREIQSQAMRHGLVLGRKDPLPEYVLALDELKPSTSRNYTLVLEDLSRASASFVVIGCREGDEAQLLEDLQQGGHSVEVVYLGKLGRNEVHKFAEILSPQRPMSIVDNVMKIVRSERLPRTPFTIALLVVLLARGAADDSLNNSETTVLDRYVNLLIGRSGPFLDPRRDLDPQNREVVLAQLAKYFVRRRRGALNESDVVGFIEEYFLSRDWTESAAAALESFRNMRLLRVQGTSVQFRQTSYLHLFAAKAAIRDEQFLAELLEDPLYFAPIIRHYAALVRDSIEVLAKVRDVLRSWEVAPSRGSFYGRIAKTAVESTPTDVDEEEPEDAVEPVEQGPTPYADTDSEGREVDNYDASPDADRVPFPLQDPEEWTARSRLSVALELGSRVLRDSDDVPDLDLKGDVFRLVAQRWGYLGELLDEERVFEELAVDLADQFVASGLLTEERRAGFVESFSLSLTGFALYSGLLSTLTSRKLIRTYERVREDVGIREDPYSALILALFALTVKSDGWAVELSKLMEQHGERWSTLRFMKALIGYEWEYTDLTQSDQLAVKQFLKDAYDRRRIWPDERTRRINLKKHDQQLQKDRAKGQAERRRGDQRSIGGSK